MALQYAHGSFTWGSGDSVGATYTCSPGFQAQLIRVWCMGINSGTDAATETVNLVRSMGYATSTSNRFCAGTFSIDASAAADCSVALMDNCVLVTTAGSTTVTGALDLDSISSTSFNLINDNAPDQSMTVFWEAWNDDVSGFTMWAGGFSAPGATGDQNITGLTGLVSGNPDGDQLLVCFSKQATAAVNSAAANDSGLGIGWATGAGGSGSSEQVVCWGNSDDASATMDTDGACHSGLVIALCAAGGAATESNRAYLKSWDTDGLTLTWDAAGTNRFGYVVIKGGQWRAGELTLDTTAVSNTATVSGLAFQPVGIEFMGRRSAEQSHNVAVAGDVLSWGCASSTSSRRAMGCWDEDATANSEINLVIEYDGVLAYPTNAGAIDAVYDLSAINSDGFQVIVDDAPGTGNASEWIGYLAFAGAASGGTSTTLAGVDGTGAAGVPTVSAAASTGLTGVAGTGAAGTPAAAITASAVLGGVTGASAAGNPTVSGTASTPLTGVPASGAVGAAVVSAAASSTVPGVGSTAGSGTVGTAIGATVPVAGTSGSGASGSVSTSANASTSVPGAPAIGTAGSASVSASASTGILGITATGIAGSTAVVIAVSATPSGAPGTGAAGSLAASAAATTAIPSAAGAGAAAAVAVSGRVTAPVIGAASAGSAGAPSTIGHATVPVTGAAGTGAVGTPTVASFAVASISGVTAAGQSGAMTVLISTTVAVDGVQGSAAVGSLSVGGGIVASVSGVQTTGAAGDLTVSTSVVVGVPAVFATGAAGIVVVSGQANVPITGVEATALAGVLAALVAESGIPAERIVTIELGQRSVAIGAHPRTAAVAPGARIIEVKVSTRAVPIGPSNRTIH